MANTLSQLSGEFFLMDRGIDTTSIFPDGLALPDFAAFTLLPTKDGNRCCEVLEDVRGELNEITNHDQLRSSDAFEEIRRPACAAENAWRDGGKMR